MAVKVKGDKTRILTDAERASAKNVVRLICVDSDDNNNKCWHGFHLANGDWYAEWGRVNKSLQHEYYAGGDHHDAAEWLADKSHEKQNKSGKASYTLQRTIATNGPTTSTVIKSGSSDLKNLAQQQIAGDAETKKLVTWLAEVNVHQITKNTQITYNVATGVFSTPLGLVTPDGIVEARDILGDLSSYVAKHDWDNSSYKKYLENYLRIVPQELPAQRGWHRTIFAASDALQKQEDILDSLEASLQQSGKQAAGTKQAGVVSEKVFDVKLDTVVDSKILEGVKAKYNADKGWHSDVQHLKPYKVWAVTISTVRDAFQKDGKILAATRGNLMQLWHGTKASNLLSILKGGLVIPKFVQGQMAGRMFGDGVYFSDQSTKSLRYATSAWTGGGNTERKFMFLADVAMGKPYHPTESKHSGWTPPSGYDSCFAKGGQVKSSWGILQNNEQIVYRTSQADLIYLIEFR